MLDKTPKDLQLQYHLIEKYYKDIKAYVAAGDLKNAANLSARLEVEVYCLRERIFVEERRKIRHEKIIYNS